MNNRLPHCRPGTTDAMQRLADENEALRARVERLTYCAKESQDWNWVESQESSRETEITYHEILEKQKLRYIANFETPTQSLAHIHAAGAREALERAMKVPGFSDTVVRVDLMREIIEQMEGKNV